MRSAKVWIPLAILLALVFGVYAQAGGKGAVKGIMYEASLHVFTDTDRVVADGPQVGFVIFNSTVDNKMTFLVKLQDGEPDTTFDVSVRPRAWGSTNGVTLTTDSKGRGSVSFEMDIPQNYINNGVAPVKVQLNHGDDDYATDSRDPVPETPDTSGPAPSTTYRVNLK